jgi:hypothetical protein
MGLECVLLSTLPVTSLIARVKFMKTDDRVGLTTINFIQQKPSKEDLKDARFSMCVSVDVGTHVSSIPSMNILQ